MNFNEYKNKVLSEDKVLKEIYFDKEREFEFQVAHLITEARLYAGLTQNDLATKIKTKQPSIARIERGLSLPSLSFLQKIAKALNTYIIAPKFGFMDQKAQSITNYIYIDISHGFTGSNTNKAIQSNYYNLDELRA